MAPFTPFLAEELYRNLTGKESVHLVDWPEPGHVNDDVIENMKLAREVINDGLSKRAKAGLKVRQPLRSVTISKSVDQAAKLDEEYLEMIKEELNVKSVIVGKVSIDEAVELDVTLDNDLIAEGLMREVIRHIQALRKEKELQVDDHIATSIHTADVVLHSAINTFVEEIAHETLSDSLNVADAQLEHAKHVSVEKFELQIAIRKTS